MTTATERRTPTSAAQVWAILVDDGFYLPPIDDDGTGVFMAWATREEAERGLKYQLERGYVDEEAKPKVVRLV